MVLCSGVISSCSGSSNINSPFARAPSVESLPYAADSTRLQIPAEGSGSRRSNKRRSKSLDKKRRLSPNPDKYSGKVSGLIKQLGNIGSPRSQSPTGRENVLKNVEVVVVPDQRNPYEFDVSRVAHKSPKSSLGTLVSSSNNTLFQSGIYLGAKENPDVGIRNAPEYSFDLNLCSERIPSVSSTNMSLRSSTEGLPQKKLTYKTEAWSSQPALQAKSTRISRKVTDSRKISSNSENHTPLEQTTRKLSYQEPQSSRKSSKTSHGNYLLRYFSQQVLKPISFLNSSILSLREQKGPEVSTGFRRGQKDSSELVSNLLLNTTNDDLASFSRNGSVASLVSEKLSKRSVNDLSNSFNAFEESADVGLGNFGASALQREGFKGSQASFTSMSSKMSHFEKYASLDRKKLELQDPRKYHSTTTLNQSQSLKALGKQYYPSLSNFTKERNPSDNRLINRAALSDKNRQKSQTGSRVSLRNPRAPSLEVLEDSLEEDSFQQYQNPVNFNEPMSVEIDQSTSLESQPTLMRESGYFSNYTSPNSQSLYASQNFRFIDDDPTGNTPLPERKQEPEKRMSMHENLMLCDSISLCEYTPQFPTTSTSFLPKAANPENVLRGPVELYQSSLTNERSSSFSSSLLPNRSFQSDLMCMDEPISTQTEEINLLHFEEGPENRQETMSGEFFLSEQESKNADAITLVEEETLQAEVRKPWHSFSKTLDVKVSCVPGIDWLIALDQPTLSFMAYYSFLPVLHDTCVSVTLVPKRLSPSEVTSVKVEDVNYSNWEDAILVQLDEPVDLHLSRSQSKVAEEYKDWLRENLAPVLVYHFWADENNFRDVIKPWAVKNGSNFWNKSADRTKSKLVGEHNLDSSNETARKIEKQAGLCFQLIENLYSDRAYFFEERPSSVDAEVFGLLAPILFTPTPSPSPSPNHAQPGAGSGHSNIRWLLEQNEAVVSLLMHIKDRLDLLAPNDADPSKGKEFKPNKSSAV